MARRVRTDDEYYEAMPAARGVYRENAVVVTAGDRAAQVVYVITTAILTLLAFRLVLRLFAASTASSFVSFVYALTAPLVSPFFGVFNLTIDDTVPGFEVATIVAMVVYAAIGYLLGSLIRAVRGRAL